MLDYEISATEAAALLKEGKTRIIDVREPWEFETTRVDGSLPMPMGEVAARAHQELEPDERLVVLCHHGARSQMVVDFLRDAGFDNAVNLDGGIEAWACEIDRTMRRYR